MGLAAGQARLLSITGRKSDCEFQSMRLSHQKIALARELADLSNEYQNSLNQTKLIYDYYGTGDTSTPLSYGLMMTPSALNDYMPIIVSDALGRVTLDSKLAQAARAAGIPQEGLGCLPSEVMRNLFIEGLSSQGLITADLSDRIQGLPYNQAAGMGGGVVVMSQTQEITYDELIKKLSGSANSWLLSDSTLPSRNLTNAKGKSDTSQVKFAYKNKDTNDKVLHRQTNSSDTVDSLNLTLGNLLNSNEEYYLTYRGIKGEQTPVFGIAQMQQYLTDTNGFVDWMMEEFSSVLDLKDGFTGSALDYAYNEVINLLTKENTPAGLGYSSLMDYWLSVDLKKDTDEKTAKNKDYVKDYVYSSGTSVKKKGNDDEEYRTWAVEDSKNYIGFTFIDGTHGGGDNGNDHATAGINLGNIARAFLTYYADYINGISKTDQYGDEVLDVNKGKLIESHLVDNSWTFNVKIGTEVSSDDLGQATFYDALFNQICSNGWTENNNIRDNEYLKQMLQSGMQFISRVKDDRFYYQGNYSTDSYIKEITDESAIAYAEAKYSTEKAKLNAKEETIDLKMKNLDTEISSLTTEYDTVKNTISKNIDKSFKRYNA